MAADPPDPPASPAPPADPRDGWRLPALGAMPVVEHLDEATTRVLAANPSPMTLDGTNTYVVGEPGSGAVVVVDPGPTDPAHLEQTRRVVAARDAEVVAILVTHHHRDHAAAAAAWSRAFRAPLAAADPAVAGPGGRVLRDGDVVDVAGLSVVAVATPGHTRDHVAFRLATGALLTGDHVLGRGTSVITHPDGDLVAYLAGLRRILALGPDVLHPGHGPSLRDDPSAVVRYYLEHRAVRLRQVLEVLAGGPTTPQDLVARLYPDLGPGLRTAAEASVRATLAALEADGRVVWRSDDRVGRVDG